MKASMNHHPPACECTTNYNAKDIVVRTVPAHKQQQMPSSVSSGRASLLASMALVVKRKERGSLGGPKAKYANYSGHLISAKTL